jgi:hypothetical protein
MRVFNQYLFFLVLTACIINTTLAFMGQRDLTVYFIANVVAYLIITILHAYLNPRARQLLNVISIVLFAGFMTVVVFKVIEVL